MGVKSVPGGLPPRFNLLLENILFAIFASQLFHCERGVLSLIIVVVQTLISKIR